MKGHAWDGHVKHSSSSSFSSGLFISLADFVQVASLAREELEGKGQVWVFVELVEHGDDIPSCFWFPMMFYEFILFD
jgi:hypothetical protein